MGGSAGQLRAKPKAGGRHRRPALYHFGAGDGVKGRVAFYSGEAFGIKLEEVAGAAALGIKGTNPIFVGPDGTAKVEGKKHVRQFEAT